MEPAGVTEPARFAWIETGLIGFQLSMVNCSNGSWNDVGPGEVEEPESSSSSHIQEPSAQIVQLFPEVCPAGLSLDKPVDASEEGTPVGFPFLSYCTSILSPEVIAGLVL